MHCTRIARPAAALVAVAAVLLSPAYASAKAQDDAPETKPDASKPDTAKPDAAKPDAAKPDEAKPEEPKKGPLSALKVDPFIGIVGGVKVDNPLNGPDEHKESRVSALALSRFGLRGTAGAWISFDSELMASGGAGLRGSSAYEGQAALQVRNQLLRLTIDPAMVEVGRITDEASVDFFSQHVNDVFMQDTATRDPLLYSGFNMGNGVRGTFKIIEGLRVGLTFTAGNPVSSTGTLMVGGTFPPYDRVYIQPYQYIGTSASTFPDDSFHMMMLSPSILYKDSIVEAKAAFQGVVIDTNTTKTDDENIKGYNVRGSVKLKLLNESLVPFANFAVTRNDTVDPKNVFKLAPDKYTGIVAGGGLDVNYQHPFHCPYDCANGIGAQYTQVEFQTGSGPVTRLHYLNLGTSYWITDHVALGLRLATWIQVQQGPPDEGERSLIATLRFVM